MDNLDNLPLNNIEELRNNCDALSLLSKASKLLDAYYFEKTIPSEWSESWETIHCYLTDFTKWEKDIWNNRKLYIYSLFDKNCRKIKNVPFDSLIFFMGMRTSEFPQAPLYLTAFKISDGEDKDKDKDKDKLSDKIENLIADVSEIKKILKKMGITFVIPN